LDVRSGAVSYLTAFGMEPAESCLRSLVSCASGSPSRSHRLLRIGPNGVDITAAHQLVNGHFPLVAENRGFALPVMYVFTNNTLIDKRARALADLREIIQQNGTRIAGNEMPYRIAYKDMQTGTTLYAGGRLDPKAIAESEAIFAEIVQYVIEANRSTAAE
jgi:hypothetical protein